MLARVGASGRNRRFTGASTTTELAREMHASANGPAWAHARAQPGRVLSRFGGGGPLAAQACVLERLAFHDGQQEVSDSIVRVRELVESSLL